MWLSLVPMTIQVLDKTIFFISCTVLKYKHLEVKGGLILPHSTGIRGVVGNFNFKAAFLLVCEARTETKARYRLTTSPTAIPC